MAVSDDQPISAANLRAVVSTPALSQGSVILADSWFGTIERAATSGSNIFYLNGNDTKYAEFTTDLLPKKSDSVADESRIYITDSSLCFVDKGDYFISLVLSYNSVLIPDINNKYNSKIVLTGDSDIDALYIFNNEVAKNKAEKVSRCGNFTIPEPGFYKLSFVSIQTAGTAANNALVEPTITDVKIYRTK